MWFKRRRRRRKRSRKKIRKDAINIKICSIAIVHTQHSVQFKIQYVKIDSKKRLCVGAARNRRKTTYTNLRATSHIQTNVYIYIYTYTISLGLGRVANDNGSMSSFSMADMEIPTRRYCCAHATIPKGYWFHRFQSLSIKISQRTWPQLRDVTEIMAWW